VTKSRDWKKPCPEVALTSGNIDVPDEMLNVAMNINNPTILMEILSNKLLNAAIISEALWYGCHRESIVQFIIFRYV
jgi:hypothetical protein